MCTRTLTHACVLSVSVPAPPPHRTCTHSQLSPHTRPHTHTTNFARRAALQDFPRIATFLPGRTVEEVVRLYYAVQRTDEFSQTRRKYLLRKRREQVRRLAWPRAAAPAPAPACPCGVAPPGDPGAWGPAAGVPIAPSRTRLAVASPAASHATAPRPQLPPARIHTPHARPHMPADGEQQEPARLWQLHGHGRPQPGCRPGGGAPAAGGGGAPPRRRHGPGAQQQPRQRAQRRRGAAAARRSTTPVCLFQPCAPAACAVFPFLWLCRARRRGMLPHTHLCRAPPASPPCAAAPRTQPQPLYAAGCWHRAAGSRPHRVLHRSGGGMLPGCASRGARWRARRAARSASRQPGCLLGGRVSCGGADGVRSLAAISSACGHGGERSVTPSPHAAP